MVDSVALKNSIKSDFSQRPFVKNNFDLASIMFDSLYPLVQNEYQSNIDISLNENDFSYSIVLYKDSILNSRIKWKMSNDKYPRSAMVAILCQNDSFSIIGFCKIPLSYITDFSK